MKNGFRLIYFVKARDWDPQLKEYPLLAFQEVIDLETTRVVEIWGDGLTGIGRSSDMLELGGTRLPDQLDSEIPTPRTETVEVEISREQFEICWRNAVKRVQWELGTAISP